MTTAGLQRAKSLTAPQGLRAHRLRRYVLQWRGEDSKEDSRLDTKHPGEQS